VGKVVATTDETSVCGTGVVAGEVGINKTGTFSGLRFLVPTVIRN
jgi:hypothetical protein